MDMLSRHDIERLSQKQGVGPAISIYMPTHSFGEDVKKGQIMLKNLVGEAEEQLIARGVRPQERKKLLELPMRLMEDSMFWSYQSEGLAIFLSAGQSSYYRLPVRFRQMTVTMDTFYIKPLLSLFAGDGQFAVLALSHKSARLLVGSRYSVEEVGLGKDVEEFEQEIELQFPETSLQFTSGTARQGGGGTAVYFSHGGEIDSALAEKLQRYFRLIDKKLVELLDQNRVPVVLAAVDYLIPLFKGAGKYPLVLDTGVKGNPEHSKAKELHSKGWEIAEPYFVRKQEEAKARFAEYKADGKVATDVKDIVEAAYFGRVDTLFVAVDKNQWGTFDPENNEVLVTDEPAADHTELLDFAAVHTFLKNGTVYAVEQEEMPDSEPLAALLRY